MIEAEKKEKMNELMNKISFALKDATLQQGFEIICKRISELETVQSFEEWLTPEIHAEIMNGYSSAEDKMKLAKKIYERAK